MSLPTLFPPAQPANGSVTEGIVAFASGGQANATQLVSRFNHVATVATAADSVKLPPFQTNMSIYVANDGGAALAVFPYETPGKMNNGSAGAAFSVASGKAAVFVATGTANRWSAVLSA